MNDPLQKLENTQNFKAFEEYRALGREIKHIDDLLTASIWVCGVCSDTKWDRVYDPISQAWYCVPCYEKYVKDNPEDVKYDELYEERVEYDIGLPKKK